MTTYVFNVTVVDGKMQASIHRPGRYQGSKQLAEVLYFTPQLLVVKKEGEVQSYTVTELRVDDMVGAKGRCTQDTVGQFKVNQDDIEWGYHG